MAKWKLVLSRRGEVVAPKGAPSGRRESRQGSREKPSSGASRRPPSVPPGARPFPAVPARAPTPRALCPPPHAASAPSGTRHSARGRSCVPHPSRLHLVYSPTHSSSPLPASFFPIVGDARSFNSGARSTGRWRREGPGSGRSCNPMDRRPPLRPGAFRRAGSAGCSRPGLTHGPVGCNGLELGA